MKFLVSLAFVALAGCAHDTVRVSAQDRFFADLGALCGKSFAGRRISNDPQDAGFDGKPLIMHVRDCSQNEIRIPFHAGEDRSRTWIVTRTENGLRLKHDHRHEDGTEDAVSRYGGDTLSPGTAIRQEFPADAESKTLFTNQNMAVSLPNVWAIELHPGKQYIYELKRPGRDFRVAFDLTKPLG